MVSGRQYWDGIILGAVAFILLATHQSISSTIDSMIPVSIQIFGDFSKYIYAGAVGAIVGWIIDRT